MIIKKEFKIKGGKDILRPKFTEEWPILTTPKTAVFHLAGRPGLLLSPCVKKGSNVSVGEKIAEANESFSVPVHSSISGKVKDTCKFLHPIYGDKIDSIVIESDGKDTGLDSFKSHFDYYRFTPKELLSVIKECGIVGMGGSSFPAHIKLEKRGKDVDTLIVNAVESDPFISCDTALIRENAKAVVDGIKIFLYLLDASRALIAVRTDNTDAINILRKIVFNEPNIFIAKVSSKYPSGNERILVKNLIGKNLPSNALPLEAGAVVSNTATVYAVSRSIKNAERLTSRIVTVRDVKNRVSKNVWVRNGTLIKDIADFIGYKFNPKESVVVGGIMAGKQFSTLDIPVTKAVRGIFFMGEESPVNYRNYECFRCRACVDSCPAGILPNAISTLVDKGDTEKINSYYPNECIECGTCTYVCPSFRPLFEHMLLAKEAIRER